MATPLSIPTRDAGTVNPPADINTIVSKLNEMYPNALDIPTRAVGTGDPAGDVNKIVTYINAHIAATGTTPAAPTLASLDPTSALPGATIILTGTGFTGALNVLFAGVGVGSGKFQVLSDTQITAVVPQVSAGSNPVQVVGSTATSSARAFVVQAPASNMIPVASASSPAAITLPTNQAALTVTRSDPDGTIAAEAWRQVTGPNTATGMPATVQNPVVSGLIAGTYQFGYRAQDNQGAWSQEVFVNVTVNPAASTKLATPSLSAVPTSSSTIALRWSAVSGAIVYQVRRRTDSQVVYIGSNLSFINRELAALSTYAYDVLAVAADSVNNSDYSTAASATTPAYSGRAAQGIRIDSVSLSGTTATVNAVATDGSSMTYNVDGGTFQSSSSFTGLSTGNHILGARLVSTNSQAVYQISVGAPATAPKPFQWVFMGDSITHSPTQTSYPQHLQNAVGSNGMMVNAGNSGDTTQQMLDRVQADAYSKYDASTYAFNAFSVMGGINDTARNIDVATTKANLAKMYTDAAALGFKCWALLIIPSNPMQSYGPKIKDINDYIIANCKSWGCIDYIDTFSIPAMANPADEFIYPDGLHPSAAGKQYLARVIKRTLDAYCLSINFPVTYYTWEADNVAEVSQTAPQVAGVAVVWKDLVNASASGATLTVQNGGTAHSVQAIGVSDAALRGYHEWVMVNTSSSALFGGNDNPGASDGYDDLQAAYFMFNGRVKSQGTLIRGNDFWVNVLANAKLRVQYENVPAFLDKTATGRITYYINDQLYISWNVSALPSGPISLDGAGFGNTVMGNAVSYAAVPVTP